MVRRLYALNMAAGQASTACNHLPQQARLSATIRCLQGLVIMGKRDGLRGMFKGNGTNCVRIIPNSAVKFMTYEQLSR